MQKIDQASGEKSSNDGNSTGDASSNDGNSTGDASNGNSTGDENALTGNSRGISTGNGSASTTITTQFDAKLKHMLTHFLNATGANHHIQKAFIHKQILTFEEFTDGYTVENIKTFQQDDGNNNLVQAFSSVKLTLVTNVILYYNFLQDDNQEALAEDPVNWVKADFRKWRRNPTQTATQTTATQIASNTTTTPPSTTKLEDDALLNWRKNRQDVTKYPIIDNDVQYPNWIIKIGRVFLGHEYDRMIDDTVHFSSVQAGSNLLLWNAQKNHLSKVLDHVLKTNEGMKLV